MADVLSSSYPGQHDFVRLEPLEKSHAEVIFQAGDSEEIWQYLPDDLITVENVLSWIERQLQQPGLWNSPGLCSFRQAIRTRRR